MDANPQIRSATAEDSEGLGKCMASAYAPYQQRMNGKRLPPMDVDYAAEIENYPVWIVGSGEHVIGGLIMDFENGKALIANIAIHPDSQGQGIGGKLMKYAEAKAKEKNFAELHLATHVLLDENISLYRHLGWQETGRDGYRVFMRKKI
jgi:GNAT superfamily N-acetyltransferase